MKLKYILGQPWKWQNSAILYTFLEKEPSYKKKSTVEKTTLKRTKKCSTNYAALSSSDKAE